jgi:hypothetical protein
MKIEFYRFVIEGTACKGRGSPKQLENQRTGAFDPIENSNKSMRSGGIQRAALDFSGFDFREVTISIKKDLENLFELLDL